MAEKHAEVTHTLGENAWGFRLGCSTDNVTLIDEFVNEVHRLTFQNLFKLQHDTKACFDQIINSHAMLNSRKFEGPDKISQMYSTTLHNIEYRVQTVLDTSTNHYKHSELYHIHGNGQGTGSSGTNWVYISIPIISSLDKHKEGCIIVSSDKNFKWEKVIIGFVDDKRQYANDWQNNSLLTAYNKLR